MDPWHKRVWAKVRRKKPVALVGTPTPPTPVITVDPSGRDKAVFTRWIQKVLDEQMLHEDAHPVETDEDVRELSVLQRLERYLRDEQHLDLKLDHDRRGRPAFPAWVVEIVRAELIAEPEGDENGVE